MARVLALFMVGIGALIVYLTVTGRVANFIAALTAPQLLAGTGSVSLTLPEPKPVVNSSVQKLEKEYKPPFSMLH